MKIEVIVKPNSRKESVEPLAGKKGLSVKVNAPPEDGKANKRVIELISEYLQVPKSKIELVAGGKSKKKIFQVNE